MGAPTFCQVEVTGVLNGVEIISDPVLVTPAPILNGVEVDLGTLGTIILNGIPCPTIEPITLNLELLGLSGVISISATEVF
ncbi:hypothetical protein ACFFGV_03975 [Pontibacillus salicampi]|uniref:DUF4183 domain-containing protein n=1 Tax=Pontibacillus salicampi TaxID=1449801 RepID=A0ABV6LK27_9BACI